MPIRLLSDQLASQIAAGEVVERPSSVVKELVENAIDAGATTINLEIRQGGRELIQVADNGIGIPADELETAFLRHATSKLQTADDLEAIHTLGFRGEALAAIAAVSQLTVISRAENEQAGTRLTMEGGHKTGRETVGAPQGTVIAVENLFYNIPARLKFLKSVSTEKRLIDEFVTRYAMAYPGIRFRLTHNNRITFHTSGSGDLRDVLVEVYGVETAREMLEIGEPGVGSGDLEINAASHSPISSITVSGFAAPPGIHRANRTHITLFVNGRWVRDFSLTHAVVQAYHTLLMKGRFPLAVIFIEMDADAVDVNVHPAKTEVRFRRAGAVFSAVQKAVRHALVADSPVRNLGAWDSGGSVPSPREQFANWGGDTPRQDEFGLSWQGSGQTTRASDPQNVPDRRSPIPAPPLGGDKLPIMRVVGQVGSSYIITEGPDGMFMIDQHAAHERILYEKFMAERAVDQIASQGLMAGTAVHLSPPQATLLTENLETLSRIGFEIEPFGPNAFMVRALPAIVAKLDPTAALTAVLDDLEQGETPLQSRIEDKIILRVCKSAAVKAGQTLSRQEMEEMVRQLEACHNPHSCPHGRPTLIHLSVAQLAKQFGRI